MSRLVKVLTASLPFGVAFVLGHASLADFGVTLVGGLFLWIPYWLAWWLSDGFAGMSKWPSAGSMHLRSIANPYTGQAGAAWVDEDGHLVSYVS